MGSGMEVVFSEWPLGIVATRNRCTADFQVATGKWQDAEGVGATVGNELLIEALIGGDTDDGCLRVGEGKEGEGTGKAIKLQDFGKMKMTTATQEVTGNSNYALLSWFNSTVLKATHHRWRRLHPHRCRCFLPRFHRCH